MHGFRLTTQQLANTLLILHCFFFFLQMDDLEVKNDEEYQVDMLICIIILYCSAICSTILDHNLVYSFFRWILLKSRMVKSIQ